MTLPSRVALCLLVTGTLGVAGCSWQSAKSWKRGVCESLQGPDEREACEAEARKSENESTLEKEAAEDGAPSD